MTANDGSPPTKKSKIIRPADEFAAFCETEFERRHNAGGAFDEQQYRRAMELVLERLARFEIEGWP